MVLAISNGTESAIKQGNWNVESLAPLVIDLVFNFTEFICEATSGPLRITFKMSLIKPIYLNFLSFCYKLSICFGDWFLLGQKKE